MQTPSQAPSARQAPAHFTAIHVFDPDPGSADGRCRCGAPKKHPEHRPDFKKLRCKNCPKFFMQARENQAFCSAACRKQFHKFGSSYGALREHIEKLIAKTTRELVRQIIRDEVTEAIAGLSRTITDQVDEQLREFPNQKRVQSLIAGYLINGRYLTRAELGGEYALMVIHEAAKRRQQRIESGAVPKVPKG